MKFSDALSDTDEYTFILNTTTNSVEARKAFKTYRKQLDIYKQVCEKRPEYFASNIPVHMLFNEKEFIGYYVLGEENKFFQDTINLNQVEVRRDIRENKQNPRYGKFMMDLIIDRAKKDGYKGITLQANNEVLYTKIYPGYGFEPIGDGKETGNAMVMWFSK